MHYADETDDEEEDIQNQQTIHVQGPTAHSRHGEPGENGADGPESVLGHGQVERVLGAEAGLDVEVGGVAHEGGAAEILDGPDHDNNFCAAKIDPPEAIEIAGPGRDLLFERVGVDHHVDRVVDVEVGIVLGGQAEKRTLGILDFLLADQPPWRFRSEETPDDDGKGPHPLQSEGDLVGPFRLVGQHPSEHARGDELSHHPAEINVGGQVTPQRHRHDLGGIGGGQSLENTPWDPAEDFTDKQGLHVFGEELDEDETDDEEERADHSLAVPDLLRHDTVDEQTENLSNVGAVGKTGLPGGGDFVGTIG